jgi:hypothetical protein
MARKDNDLVVVYMNQECRIQTGRRFVGAVEIGVNSPVYHIVSDTTKTSKVIYPSSETPSDD